MQILSSSILLNGLRFYACHGVDPQETTVGTMFTVNLKIDTDFSQALESDVLEGTVNYTDLYAAVKEEMQSPSALLEHVGGRIVKRLFKEFHSITTIQLKLVKQNPPMGADCDGAGIEMVCKRGKKV